MNLIFERFMTLSVASLIILLASCKQSGTESESTSAGKRVENATLGLAIAELPADFVVETNDSNGLFLTARGPGDPGVVSLEVGPVEKGSINIVEAAKHTEATFESSPQGEFFGNQELMTPIGSFFTARGAYDQADARTEELLAFALHPNSNRLIRISFRYPAGEAAERAPQLAGLLGEIEGYEDIRP